MLSAAAAALSAAAFLPAGLSPARADTDITTSTSTILATSSGGNITIESGGSINTKIASPLITLNSNNFVLNQGNLVNDGIAGATDVQIDTSAASLLPPSTGFASNGLMSLQGNGTSKIGILVSGGHTFYGPISLSPGSSSVVSGTVVTSPAASMNLKGDGSSAIYISQGTSVTSNILVGGSITQLPSDKSTTGGGIVLDLDGTVNGNVLNSAAITGIGNGIRGIYTAGGIHSCASDTAAPSGFTCPTFSEGALINTGSVSLGGTSIRKTNGVNLEGGSALVIGGSVDGGVINAGPGTSSSLTAATLQSSGVRSAPTVLIDPYQSVNSNQATPRGPVVIGPAPSTVDSTDPGYSFINRGTIQAAPIDAQVSAMAMAIRGNSTANYTCLSAVVGSCASVDGNGNAGGGLLNTGTISAAAATNQAQTVANPPTGLDQFVTATALDVGGFATVPNIEVKSEAIDSTNNTPATIKGEVSGMGQGTAYGVFIEEGATVNTIKVSRNASILAGVTTFTTSPTADIAQAGAPFSLLSEAIVDRSSTLSSIVNSGVIQANNTQLTPAAGAVVSNIQRAIDLQSSTKSGITINNSGAILGDILFGSASNNDTLNVGNVDGGTINNVTGTTNTASNWAVVALTEQTQSGGAPPLSSANIIDFRSGNDHQLHIGSFGYVNSTILANDNALDVTVDNNGYLFVANTATTGSMKVNNLTMNGGTLGLTIAQNTSSSTPVILANQADISHSTLALQFGSFVSSGNTAASTASPTPQKITLISATQLIDNDLAAQNATLRQNTPFLFEDPNEAGYNSDGAITAANTNANGDPLSTGASGGKQTLELTLLPRSTGAKNADGTAGLNLSGDARVVFPYAAQALGNDNELGAAVASNLTVYNTGNVPSSGINIPKSQQAAQQVFSQFGPDVSGGARQVAIMLTDQATGPVAARQRLLRNFSHTAGEMTLWGEEFTGQISNKGQVSGSGALTAYKDHGFGFVLGMDGGSPRGGWYGGAFSFYTGDIVESLPRASKTQTEWYMLSAYSQWSGRHVFFDTQGSFAYGNFTGSRSLSVGSINRTAESKRAGLMGALGAKGGVMLKYIGFEVDPHISLDGLVLREEGYTESGGGNGMDLAVAPYYANSLRTALGVDLRLPLDIWGVELAPEARAGYRYDLIGSPVKLKAGFVSTGGLGTVNNTIKFVGPDPDQGNTILGLGIGASTDTWHLGGQYDWVRGNNGSTTQVGMITLLARI
ncbi:MAG: hypothetical protein BGN85_12710 [Alphaproteobacteria bacterium 64-11]|nr:MAG: hypothetical protein BGN85_12710 [Alphaproteobacteria bacterium 64-11]